jgi:hypothetical protein
MTKEFRHLGHTIVIPSPEEPRQSGREVLEKSQEAEGGHPDPAEGPPPEEMDPGTHHQHPGQDDSGMGHGGPSPPIMLTIDGEEVMVHLLPSGYFYTHELPFMRYSSLEDLAKDVVVGIELKPR